MNETPEPDETQAEELCKSCGMCCNGQLFAWVKLKPAELDPAEKLGLRVFRSDPNQRGFNQPCPLWRGTCTVYHSPHYPRACRAYRCKLLKEMDAGNQTLPEAQERVAQAQALIAALEPLLPASENLNFRERVVAYYEHPEHAAGTQEDDREFRRQADALIDFYREHFGVTDLLE
jgi:uncharacterized protein